MRSVKVRSVKTTLWLVALLGLAACGEENPVELGGILPGGGIRSGEVVLDAPAFLAWDSVRSGFVRPSQAGFVIAAAQYGGSLDAHGLIRLKELPRTRSYNDAEGTLRVDTLPDLVGGRLSIRVDTLRTVGSGPVTVGVYQIDEDWDRNSANWTNRVDTGTVALPWATAGGTRGAQLGTAQFTPGDSVVDIPVDAAALTSLRDSTAAARGVLVQVESPGARAQFGTASLFFEIRPALLPDTLFTDSVSTTASTFLLSSLPDAAGAAALLVGGLPAWRSYLKFKAGIDTLRVPCPGGPAGCTLRLSDATINYAALELQRINPFPGFALLDTTVTEPRGVIAVDGVPIARAPLGTIGQIGSQVVVPPTGASTTVALPITTLLTAMTGDSLMRATAPSTMALLGAPEGSNLGVAAYGSLAAGPLAPRLRLIYSVTKEVQDR